MRGVVAAGVAAGALTTAAAAGVLGGPGLGYPTPLSPDLPYDVDSAAVRRLTRSGNVPEAQRLFDVFAWQTFLALNWPARPDGAPDRGKTLADARSPRVWEFMRESGTVFLEDGARPQPWAGSGEWNRAAAAARDGDAPPHRLWMHGKGDPEPEGEQFQRLDESIQAFTGPLIDQNGKWVRYEVLINRTEFDYIYENALYSLDGQVAFTARNEVSFPANRGTTRHGSMEIKLAWKQLGPDDDPRRFLVRRAYVDHMIADSAGKPVRSQPTLETMGLVGMHVAVRTESSPTWVWSTFEHVDNVAVNALERDTRGRRLRPLFNDPDLPTRTINEMAPRNASPNAAGQFTSWSEPLTTEPTQVHRIQPVDPATAQLNREVQALLRQAGSVFQHYELIGTQWPVEPAFPAFAGGMSTGARGEQVSSTPESIVFKVPGKVVPVYLVNSTMETFFMHGNQPAGPLEEDDRLPAGELSDTTTVFGTESCNGCHFSAGAAVGFKTDRNGRVLTDANGYRVPVFGKNASFGRTGGANYSWLLQMRARSAPVARARR